MGGKSLLPRGAGIYAIRCRATDERYVGATTNIRMRRNVHFTRLRGGAHPCKRLQAVFSRHGEAGFEWLTVELLPPHLGEREQTQWLHDAECHLMRSVAPELLLNESDQAYRARKPGGRLIKDVLAEFRKYCVGRGESFRDELDAALAAHMLKKTEPPPKPAGKRKKGGQSG